MVQKVAVFVIQVQWQIPLRCFETSVAHRRTENDSQLSETVTPVNTASDFYSPSCGFQVILIK